jgi:hypothetical protein
MTLPTQSTTGPTNRELVQRLFMPGDRWGWEYVPVDPERLSPLLNSEPSWVEPSPPDLEAARRELADDQQRQQFLTVLTGVLLLSALLALISSIGRGAVHPLVTLLLLVLMFPLLFLWIVAQNVRQARAQIPRLQAEYEQTRRNARAEFEAEHARWDQSVDSWQRGERTRVAQTKSWFPVAFGTEPTRIDVLGGTYDGWAALLVTAGSGMLGAGQSVVVLDMTSQDVGGDLLGVTRMAGRHGESLPAAEALSRYLPLDCIHPEEAAELLSSAVHDASNAADWDQREQGAELLQTALEALNGRVTLPRAVAALHVLDRSQPAWARRLLDPEELAELNDHVDTVARGRQAEEELVRLRALALLVDRSAESEQQHADATPATSSRPPTLTLVRTHNRSRRRKTITDRLLVHAWTRALQEGDRYGADVLIVAGADDLGLPVLQELSRCASGIGQRLILMFHSLREPATKMLGTDGSAAVLMRLGNADEAVAAANFIGREHRFVLNQVAWQEGESGTHGASTSTGTSTSHTKGRSRATNYAGVPQGVTTSDSVTVGFSTQRTTNWTQGWSSNQTATQTRTYDLHIEPTELQSLHQTAVLLVHPGAPGPPALVGNCDPRIGVLDQTSSQPRSLPSSN